MVCLNSNPAVQEKNQLIDLLGVLNEKTRKIKKHVKEAKAHARNKSRDGEVSRLSRTRSPESRRSSSRQ